MLPVYPCIFYRFDSTQQPLPEYLCGDKLTAVSSPRSLYLAKGGDENCKKSTSYVWPVGEKYLHQGLIVVELSQVSALPMLAIHTVPITV